MKKSYCQRFVRYGKKVASRKRKCGRKRCCDDDDDNTITQMSLRNRFLTASDIHRQEVLNSNISVWTIRRRLKEKSVMARTPAIKCLLTENHKQKRLQWANAKADWTYRNWKNIVFSDES